MLRPHCRVVLPLALLLTAFAGTAVRADLALPKESWSGMYLSGKKIGYSQTIIENSTFKDKPGLKITSHVITRLEMFGNKVEQNIDFTIFCDKGYAPIHQDFKMESNGSASSMTADYLPGKIKCVLHSGGGDTAKTVIVPPGAKLVGDSSVASAGKNVMVGTKDTVYSLNPLTFSLDKIGMEVKAIEKVTLAGTTYDAYRILMTTNFGPLTSWETKEGEPIKSELPAGMALFRENKEIAMDLKSAPPKFAVVGGGKAVASTSGYNPPKDFALATAITVNKPIPMPRFTKSLKVVVKGIDDTNRVISDDRQHATKVGNGSYQMAVDASVFDASKSVSLPIEKAEVQTYLQRAAYLETDNPDIANRAAELRGSETNAYKVALNIRKWVHSTMKPDYTIGVPQSCVALYKSPRGVCRDYATLFAGVARAAGIPTRVVAGIEYAEGKFFYHAWDECWVGRWVAIDPTLPTDFVDATHIKFAQGDVTEMYNVGGIVGRIKLDVLKVN